MELLQLLALGIFASYFLIIIALFWVIVQSSLVSRSAQVQPTWYKLRIFTFVILALGSFAHTWLYMFKFIAWSFSEYEKSISVTDQALIPRVSSWLVDTALFEQAWAAVCFDPINWWWSEQLCLFTVGAWTIFLATQGYQLRIKYLWAYMLLGQVVAISVASNLFYLAVTLSQPSAPSKSPSGISRAHPVLWISVIVSLITIGISPFTSERTFLPNLLIMHALLVVPLLSSRPSVTRSAPSRFSIRLSTLYSLVLAAAFAIRLRTTLTAVNSLRTGDQSCYGFLVAAWDILHSHPAQSSIGWDVVWTTISFVAWISLRPAENSPVSKLLEIPYLLLASPLASVGVTAPYILRPHDAAEVSKEE